MKSKTSKEVTKWGRQAVGCLVPRATEAAVSALSMWLRPAGMDSRAFPGSGLTSEPQ